MLRERAVEVLRDNDLGTMITAAPRLYPHMWSWDAAFVAMGLAQISVPRAIQEMRTLVGAQWASGMIPHIVFSEAPGYFPDVHRWGTIGASPPGVRAVGSANPRCTPSPCGSSSTRPVRPEDRCRTTPNAS